MKVVSKQNNSRMCIICGMDNALSVKAPFYNMEDGSCMSVFQFKKEHQSYPQRVHGGLITAMLDEIGLRATWALKEDTYGVTTSLDVKFRKPVPYEEDIIAKGIIESQNRMFVIAKAFIYNKKGEVLAEANLKYLKLDPAKIGTGDADEEMCYHIIDDLKEINFEN